MARATRSSTNHEKDKNIEPVQQTARGKTKKRKRHSVADNDEQPSAKQPRTENGIKEETAHDVDKLEHDRLADIDGAGDVPINPLDAQRILDILELSDTQGLLDRVFPLPSSSSGPSTSKSQSRSYSFRNLLKESSEYSLSVLRSAVQQLWPISSHPRSRVSKTAAEQLQFCNLALSLLDQASFHSVPFPVELETILPQQQDSTTDDVDVKAPDSPILCEKAAAPPRRRYALMQRLPTGNWWTSLNSEFAPLDGKNVKELHTAHAELVAILPSPSTLTYRPDTSSAVSSLPDGVLPSTLGSYPWKRPPGPKPKLPGPRRVSCGSFLDYGPYASFAPTFDQEGLEIGRTALGEVIWSWEERKKAWLKQTQVASLERGDQPSGDVQPDDDIVVLEQDATTTVEHSAEKAEKDMDPDKEALEGLLSPSQVTDLKAALGTLELEDAVQELLDRNRKALERLRELQILRLSKQDQPSEIGEVSEERQTAQGILDSLSVLASLRPRTSGADTVPLIPPAPVLRRLHRTLPFGSSEGWFGTLPPGRTTALRDDSTLYVKSAASVLPTDLNAAPPVAPPGQSMPPATPAAGQPYPGYPYPSYPPPFRGYQYKPGQAAPYYSGTYSTPQGQSQTPPVGYYPNQQYNAAGQPQYSYSSWYYQPPGGTNPGQTSNSGRGTPQPSTSGGVPPSSNPSSQPPVPPNYAGFFNPAAASSIQAPSTQRAVANTVLTATSGKAHQQAAGAAWTGNAPGGYTAPTIPQYLRSATGVGGATATQPAGTYQQHGYYGTTYQPMPAQ